MHTRRFGAFLLGAWLLGSLMAVFAASQGPLNIERIFSDPPPQMIKLMGSLDADSLRQLFRFQAAQFNRHFTETWEVLQLGLAAALLVTFFFTSHRSRILMGAAGIMAAIVVVIHFFLTPAIHQLARSFDFVSAVVSPEAREEYIHFLVWRRVLEIFKILLSVVLFARLLFDRNDWRKHKPASADASLSARR